MRNWGRIWFNRDIKKKGLMCWKWEENTEPSQSPEDRQN